MLGSFFCGLRDDVHGDGTQYVERPTLGGKRMFDSQWSRFASFCKVGSGFTIQDLVDIT
jgi:ATP-dependent DNA ligase